MGFPGFVKDHPVISATVFFIAAGFIGFTALNFSQGSFAGGDPGSCTWQEAVNPNTGETFESKQAFKDYFENNDREVPEGLQLEYRDGVLKFKAPCGSVGEGGTTQ